MEESKLKRTLGLFSAIMIGVGGAMGTGLFILVGTAAGRVGPGVVFWLKLSSIFALFKSRK